jgi:hypothetical protein
MTSPDSDPSERAQKHSSSKGSNLPEPSHPSAEQASDGRREALGKRQADPEDEAGIFGFVAKLLLVGSPFLLAAVFLILDWWLR